MTDAMQLNAERWLFLNQHLDQMGQVVGKPMAYCAIRHPDGSIKNYVQPTLTDAVDEAMASVRSWRTLHAPRIAVPLDEFLKDPATLYAQMQDGVRVDLLDADGRVSATLHPGELADYAYEESGR